MKPPNQKQAIRQVKDRLAELLDLDPAAVAARDEPPGLGADALIDLGTATLVVEWKSSGAPGQVFKAVRQVREHAATLGPRAVPIVAVPFMGPLGREHCKKEGVGWLDLSGNAHIVAPGMRIRVEGQPNLYKRPGRPSSAFAPKSARIARWLLLFPDRSMTQREIAQATKMDEGFTSRIVARLEADELIVRNSSGAIKVRDPDLLLDAWREQHNFSRQETIRGHMATRSAETLVRRLADEFRNTGVEYAATGLAAAWLFNQFAGFRIVTMYVAERPQSDVLEVIGFREDARGENVRLVVPDDEGVFHGSSDRGGVRCVHPVQAYLDLKDQPERANEAADQLRSALLTWKVDG